MEVKAAVAYEVGKPLTIEKVQLSGPQAGEVLIEIKASGVCHTDAYTLSGADPEGLFPVILGHEGAGVVVECGHKVKKPLSQKMHNCPVCHASLCRDLN